jgi:hypothetical protein
MAARKTGLSIAGFVLGCLSLACFPFGLIAVVLGAMALHKIHRAPETFGGKGLAWAGIILGVLFGLINLAAGIVLPEHLAAYSKAPQHRTMTEMKSIGVAWESYQVDFSTYCPKDRPTAAFAWGNISAAELKGMLSPDYVQTMPEKDGWGRPFQFGVECPEGGKPAYWIRSAGKDGKWDKDTYQPDTRSRNFNADIVFSNGEFVQWPGIPKEE